MRTAVISSVKDGMATVVYETKTREASNPMPILANAMNVLPKVGDRVVVAPLNGKKDGIILGTYWNMKNLPKQESDGA